MFAIVYRFRVYRVKMPSSFPRQQRSTGSEEEDDSKDSHEGQSWSPRSLARGMLELFRRPSTGGNTRHDFASMCCFMYNLLFTLDPWSQPKLSHLGVGYHQEQGTR